MNRPVADLPLELFRPAHFDERAAELTGFSRYSYWRSTIRTFLKSPVSILLLVVIVVLVGFAFVFPLVSHIDPNRVDLASEHWNLAPSGSHPFGTDSLGRDIWARAWYGTRTSILLALTIAFFDVGIGMIAGALWGYVRRIDRIMTELYNVLNNIPQYVYLVLLTYILRPSFWTIVFALCSTGWTEIARFVRNKVITIRDAEYNIASRCLDTPLRRMITKNVLPYVMSILIMMAALTIPYSIGAEVFLGFIHLGLPIDMVSLGNLVNLGKDNFMLYPWQLTWPTVIVAAITISFYIAGNRFSDASDPRNHV